MNLSRHLLYKMAVFVTMTFLIGNLVFLTAMFRLKEEDAKFTIRSIFTKPIILIWHPPFNIKNVYRADSKVCGEGIDCVVSYDRKLVNMSAAVVFHFYKANMKDIPKSRLPEQLYVWWSGEKNHDYNLKEFDQFYNLTFTYRRDSDIYAPYGSMNIILEELRKTKEHDLKSLLQKKKESGKVAAWAVSNCVMKRRMKIANDMEAAGLELDKFGRCFGGRELGGGKNTKDFYNALSQYKFYLAFENGYHCKDYITEKFWYNSLRSGAVPIVWGPKKEDVQAVAPDKSFIHVEDFSTITDLVNYINYLSKNDTAYMEYHKWKTWVTHPDLTEERFRKKELHSFCNLCQIIHEQKRERKTMIVQSLRKWWFDKESYNCLNAHKLNLEFHSEEVRKILEQFPQFQNKKEKDL